MYKNRYTSEQTYTLDEAAQILAKTRSEVEHLIRQQRLGFEMCEYGPVVTNSHLSRYLLGQKPTFRSNYSTESPRTKNRKRYPRARTRR